MKDKRLILFKLIRKHTIPLMLLLVAMVLFFICVFNPPKVYAQDQIASIDYEVCVIDGENVDLVTFNQAVVSNNKDTIIKFDNIDLQLTKTSFIEFDFLIENIVDENIKLSLELNQTNLVNFNVLLLVDDVCIGELDAFEKILERKQSVNLKVVLKIENLAFDAILNGDLNLNISQVG